MLVPLILQNLQAAAGGLAATSAIQQGAEVIEASATIASVASSAIRQSHETLSAAATVASNASSAIEHRPESLTAVAGTALAGNSAITQSPENLAVASSNAVSGSSTVSQLADTIQADGTAALSASSDIQQLSDSLEASGTLSAAAGINADAAIVLGASGFEVSAGFEVNQPAGGYDDVPKKKRYFVKHKEQLFVFDSRKAADKAMRRFQADEDAEVKPALAVSLPAVAEYAEVSGRIDSYNAAYNSAQYAQLLALFEQMQDEEDIELLLLSL